MTQNKRIAVNVIATYGRSLLSLFCGLFTARWVLLSLGEADFGLYGVVGGLTAFVAFFNVLLSQAVARFYAYYYGVSRNDQLLGVQMSKAWFNTALFVHSIISIVLIIIGYPLGVYAIHNILTIPHIKIAQCVWVWRFSCLACFVSMLNVPFQAMFNARQEIAELTVYSVGSTICNFFFVMYMSMHHKEWLVDYSLWMAMIVIVPQLLICFRACVRYRECRIDFSLMINQDRLRELFNFAGSRFIGGLSQLFCTNGLNIIVNILLGPTRNAVMTIGTNVSGQCNMLASSFVGAFSPAVTNAAGEDDEIKMRSLMYNACILSSAGSLIFTIPLLVEIDQVLKLWLVAPPRWCASICSVMLLGNILETVSCGLWMGILAKGKIKAFQIFESISWFAVVPVSIVLIIAGMDVLGAAFSLLLARMIAVYIKLYFAQRECGIRVKEWLVRVGTTTLVVLLVGCIVGLPVRFCMADSILRILVNTVVIEAILIPMMWFYMLPNSLRAHLVSKLSGARCLIVKSRSYDLED